MPLPAALTVPIHLPLISKTSFTKSSWYVWSILSIAGTGGLALEKTAVGAALSSPLITMFICLFFTNVNLLPPTSFIYNAVLNYLVPLAVPLLLLDADMKKVFTSSEQLLRAFIIGAIGTVIGTLVAFKLVPMTGLPGAGKIAAALCARHIGGAVNFVAVSEVLQTPPALVTAAIAADNVVVALYFAFLFAITKSDPPSAASASSKNSSEWRYSPINVITLSTALSLSFSINLLAQLLKHFTGFSPIITVSLLAVALATTFPSQMQSISQAGGAIGVLFMQLFFSVTGAMGHIPSVIKVAPAVFLHTTVQIVTHFLFSIGVGKLLKIPLNETALASNANVGGPTTAAAMASSKNWKALVLPALLAGVFGYSIATGEEIEIFYDRFVKLICFIGVGLLVYRLL